MASKVVAQHQRVGFICCTSRSHFCRSKIHNRRSTTRQKAADAFGAPDDYYLQDGAAADAFGAPDDYYLQDGAAQPQQISAVAAGAAAGAAEASPAVAGGTFGATVFNLVNVIMGAGYVSIPFALRQGGWAALGVLWLLGAVFCYTGNTILSCCARVDEQQQQQWRQQLERQPPPAAALPAQAAAALPPPPAAAGYEDVAGAAFGPLGRLFVSGVMYAELLGICCVYVVLEAEALSTLLGSTALGSQLSSAFGASGYILAASALIVPTVLLPSVEALAALGAVGVMAAVTVGCVVAAMYSSTPAPLTALSDTALVQLSTLPQVLGVLAFVYAGHSTFPVIQQSMRNKAAGSKAVTLGYIATAAICSLIGVFGYALWGRATEQVITANLPIGSAIALVLTVLTAANPFSAFAITLEPVALMLQRRLGRQQDGTSGDGNDGSKQQQATDNQPPYAIRAVIRLGLACACCVTAALLPYVTDLMAFVGALLTMTISLILPALMHMQLFKTDMPGWLLVFDCAVVLLGVACAYVGATSAMGSLQQKLAVAPAV